MKYILLTMATVFLCAPAGVFASADVAVVAQDTSVTVGDIVVATVAIVPRDDTVYTAKIELTYSSNLLVLDAVTLADGWLALPQKGFDESDRAKGTLVKTAGYPQGFTGRTEFARLTFKVVGSGNASVQVGAGTELLNADSKNVYEKSATPLSVTVSEAVNMVESTTIQPASQTGVATATTPPPPVVNNTETVVAESVDIATLGEVGDAADREDGAGQTNNQVASVQETTNTVSSKILYGALGILAVILGVVLYRKRKLA